MNAQMGNNNNELTWTFHAPKFLFEALRPSILYESAWLGHRRFAYDLVRFVKPKVIVELGTFSGASFFSFVQAVHDESLSAVCHAVDTWKGDRHMGYFDGDELYRSLLQIADKHYPKLTAFHQCTFDEAKELFADGTIDILHIDGCHAYDVVLHDFLNWLPKLANEGIVLFHDTEARIHDFGVFQLWDELKQKYRCQWMEFTHSFGLGVLFPKGCPDRLKPLLSRNETLREFYSKP